MTDRYVDPSVGASGTGGSWAQAYKTLLEATTAAAAGETIYFHNGAADVITGDTTYTLAAGVRVISTSDKTNNPPTTYAAGATVSTTTTGADVGINGVGSFHGVTFTLGDGSDSNFFLIGGVDGSQLLFDSCNFTLGGSSTTAYFRSGGSSTGVSAKNTFIKCSWTWGSTSQIFRLYAPTDFIDCDFSAGATHPSALFYLALWQNHVSFVGCDLSDIATVFSPSTDVTLRADLTQCKLKASATIYSPTAAAQGDVYLYDCDDGDSHIELAHYNYYGSTTISTSVYAADNIADADLSWKVEGTANASKATPYLSPWIPVYHSGTSAITPYLEVLRSGSTTSYLESEAWIDVLAKVTSGSTKSTLYTNRANPLDTATDNTDSSKGAGDWTGEDASNNWYGKLILNAAITPAEAGHILARVGLAGQYTLYVDPQIRGLA